MMDNGFKEMDNKKMVGSVILDFSAAFDIIDHELLKDKLKGYGFLPTALSWIESYLSGRKQRVFFNGSFFLKAKMCSVEFHKAAALAHFYYLSSLTICPMSWNRQKL